MKFLKRIDKYFYQYTKKELIYSILGSVLLIGFILIYYVYPMAKNYELKNQKYFNSLVEKLNMTKVQINVFNVQKIKLSNSYKLAYVKLGNLKKQKTFYEELISLLDYAKFNKQKWANYVKNMIIDAKNEGLKIKLIENKTFKVKKNKTKLKNLPKDLIVKKMSIGLNLNGSYKNFIKYMYKYENLKDLLRVEGIKIKSQNEYYIKFVLYGYDK